MLATYSFLAFAKPRVANHVKERTFSAPTFQRTLHTIFGYPDSLVVRNTNVSGLYLIWIFGEMAAELDRRAQPLLLESYFAGSTQQMPLKAFEAVMNVAFGRDVFLLYDVSDGGEITCALTPQGLLVSNPTGWQKTLQVHPDWRLPAMTAVA